jgi:hypothetical protein
MEINMLICPYILISEVSNLSKFCVMYVFRNLKNHMRDVYLVLLHR